MLAALHTPSSDGVGPMLANLGGYIFWTVAYVLILRRAFRDKSFGIPIAALCANVSWETLASTVLGFPTGPRIGNMIWLGLDLVILYTCLRFGPDDFTHPDVKKWFRPMVLIGVAVMLWAESTFVFAFGDPFGIHASWVNTFVVSAQLPAMFWRRNSLKGQSFYIGLSILLGDISGYFMIHFASEQLPGQIHMNLMNALFAGILATNVLYVTLLYRRCVQERLNPWKNW